MYDLNKRYPMPRKTIALIMGLIAVTIALFVIAFYSKTTTSTKQLTQLDWCIRNKGTVLYSERSQDYFCTINLHNGQ